MGNDGHSACRRIRLFGAYRWPCRILFYFGFTVADYFFGALRKVHTSDRRLHKLAPSVRPKSRSMSAMAMLRQLAEILGSFRVADYPEVMASLSMKEHPNAGASQPVDFDALG